MGFIKSLELMWINFTHNYYLPSKIQLSLSKMKSEQPSGHKKIVESTGLEQLHE